MTDLLTNRRARISQCGQYRYSLQRDWGGGNALLLNFVMLNPSTADADVDDPTIRRCMGFARRDGYSGINVSNLFAFRATSPKDMRNALDPIGPDNDAELRNAFRACVLTGVPMIAAWGANGGFAGRDVAVTRMAREAGLQLQCLGRTAANDPRHPLYVRADAPLQPWPEEIA